MSNSNSLGDRKNVQTEMQIIEVACSEIFTGPENFVRISKISNYTSSNQTALTVYR